MLHNILQVPHAVTVWTIVQVFLSKQQGFMLFPSAGS